MSERMNRGVEIRVGITLIVSVVVLFGAIAWLSGFVKSRAMRVWHVRFEQAGGLGEGDEVMVNGIRKGAVRKMTLVGDHVGVDLGLANEITLTRDSRVAIRNVGLMGEKVIAVDLRTTGGAWSSRDTIPGEFERGLGEVMSELGSAVAGVRGISEQLGGVSQAITNGGLKSAIENFRKTSEQLRMAVEENRAQLHATLENFNAVSRTARTLTTDREAQLRTAIDHFASAAQNIDRLTTRLDSLRTSLQSTAYKVDRGQGTLGKLVNDDKLYTELNESVKNLNALIVDVKAQPKKYFRISVF
jgi:phospholipid/cholesterol/gamma-HCH transport system substrate-binding protein